MRADGMNRRQRHLENRLFCGLRRWLLTANVPQYWPDADGTGHANVDLNLRPSSRLNCAIYPMVDPDVQRHCRRTGLRNLLRCC